MRNQTTSHHALFPPVRLFVFAHRNGLRCKSDACPIYSEPSRSFATIASVPHAVAIGFAKRRNPSYTPHLDCTSSAGRNEPLLAFVVHLLDQRLEPLVH